ncbi:MAG: hypothetical protein KIT11_09270 [Fimbriimonadaceae bacterium]|nr:hypothetical protein [Fimbriimonadaceae bacterium]QYK55517.1 MAG: hypothetical protein KF733_10940 [Fimbriimonadaceae bacterium]
MQKFTLTSFAVFLAAVSLAQYQAEAFNNGTIQAAGPRPGTNGKAFWNIEGSGNAPQFRSWGAADFKASDFNIPFNVGDITDFQVFLTQANAAFTIDGEIKFWLATDSTTSIDPGTSPYVWLDGVTPEGVGTQLTLVYLGPGSFRQIASGTTDVFSFNLTPQAKSLLISQLNSNSQVRLVVTPDEVSGPANVAATYAGYTNFNYDGPVLSFNATAGSTNEVLAPTGFVTRLGRVDAGNVGSLAADDGNVLRVCKFIVPNQAVDPVNVEVFTVTTRTNPSSLTAEVKSRMQTTGAFRQRMQFLDTTNNTWVNDLDNVKNTSFSTSTLTGTAPFSRYVAGNNRVTMRYTIRQTGPAGASLWCHEVDFVKFTVGG